MFLNLLARGTSEPGVQTLTVGPDSEAAVGTTVWLIIASGAISTNDAPFFATDSVGNTYTQPTGAHALRASSSQISILKCDVLNTIAPNTNIDISHGSPTVSASLWDVMALVFDDASTVDSVTTANAASNTVSVTSPVAAQANQLLLLGVVFAGAGTTLTPTGLTKSYTQPVGTSSVRNLTVAWDYVAAAPDVHTVGGSLSASSGWAAILVVINTPAQSQVLTPTATRAGGTVNVGVASHVALSDGDPNTWDESINNPTATQRKWDIGVINPPADLNDLSFNVLNRLKHGSASGSFRMTMYEIRSGTPVNVAGPSAPLTLTNNFKWFSWAPGAAALAAVVSWSNVMGVTLTDTAT